MKINKITSKINVLTCASIVGLISSVVLSGYDTIKARKKIDEIHNFEELSIMKKVGVVAPCYMETIAAASATTLCIIGMSNISKKNINKLSAAYASLYTNYQSYVNSVREIHNGDEDVVLNMSKKEPEYGEDEILCYEPHSDRYFTVCSIDELNNMIDKANAEFIECGVMSVNKYLTSMGFDEILNGHLFGWNIYTLSDNLNLRYKLTKMEDGMECYVLSTETMPSIYFDYA